MNDFERQPAKVHRLSTTERDVLGWCDTEGEAAARDYLDTIAKRNARKESIWLRVTAAVSVGVFLLLWSLWA